MGDGKRLWVFMEVVETDQFAGDLGVRKYLTDDDDEHLWLKPSRTFRDGQLRYGKPKEGDRYLTIYRPTHWKTATADFANDKVLILDEGD